MILEVNTKVCLEHRSLERWNAESFTEPEDRFNAFGCTQWKCATFAWTALIRICVTKSLKGFLMVTWSKTCYRRKTFPSPVPFRFARPKKLPRDNVPPCLLVINTHWQLYITYHHSAESHWAKHYPATCKPSQDVMAGIKSRCPAFNLFCSTCGKIGHFARVCHSRPAQWDATPTPAGANALSLL